MAKRPPSTYQPRPDDYFKAPLPVDLADAQLLLWNTRTYVSRYKKKVLEAKTEANRQLAERNLKGYQELKARLETHLGLIKT